MDNPVFVSAAIAAVSLLYSTTGQAGGTAYLAVMALAAFPPAEMRPTSLLLNIVAAGYATWRLQRSGAVDWGLFARLAVPSLPAAFAGGLLVLEGRAYFVPTGLLLVVAAGLLLLRRAANVQPTHLIASHWTLLAGAGVGFISGLTGVGGGVFLAPIIIVLGWTSTKRAVALSAPFILTNSVVGFAGTLLIGQRVAPGVEFYAVAALVGAVLGTAIGLRWMSEQATRFLIAVILLFAGVQLILR
jgi:uncharacterized membrane protein YfcA